MYVLISEMDACIFCKKTWYLRISIQLLYILVLVCTTLGGGAGADPGFFPRGGPVGNSATKTPQASQGKVRRGVWGALGAILSKPQAH